MMWWVGGRPIEYSKHITPNGERQLLVRIVKPPAIR
jgi:hypothetical protein